MLPSIANCFDAIKITTRGLYLPEDHVVSQSWGVSGELVAMHIAFRQKHANGTDGSLDSASSSKDVDGYRDLKGLLSKLKGMVAGFDSAQDHTKRLSSQIKPMIDAVEADVAESANLYLDSLVAEATTIQTTIKDIGGGMNGGKHWLDGANAAATKSVAAMKKQASATLLADGCAVGIRAEVEKLYTVSSTDNYGSKSPLPKHNAIIMSQFWPGPHPSHRPRAGWSMTNSSNNCRFESLSQLS